MEPRNMAIGGVFADSKRLVVPIYQRTYEWTPEHQIDTLMDYVEAKAEGRLANEPARFLHYMDALLLIPRSGFVFGRIPVFDIVDGQQRITTFQIALAALRDLAVERGEQSIADQIRPLLFNLDEASTQDKKTERFKLEPTRLDGPLFREQMTTTLTALRQTWYEHWPLPNGSNAPADLAYGLSDKQRDLVERRKSLIHVLGNLTLLTKQANLEVYNYAFDPEKRARLRASLLRLNQDVAAEAKWNADGIARRAQRLAALAIKIWPAPSIADHPVPQPANT